MSTSQDQTTLSCLSTSIRKHDPEKDMEIFILQTGLKTMEERELYEDRWISRLQTLQPKGISKDIYPYAQAVYKCFKDTL